MNFNQPQIDLNWLSEYLSQKQPWLFGISQLIFGLISSGAIWDTNFIQKIVLISLSGIFSIIVALIPILGKRYLNKKN